MKRAQITEAMKKSTPEAIKGLQQELLDWEAELKRLQDLAVLAAAKTKLESVELPAIQKELAAQEAEIPGLTTEADEVCYVEVYRFAASDSNYCSCRPLRNLAKLPRT